MGRSRVFGVEQNVRQAKQFAKQGSPPHDSRSPGAREEYRELERLAETQVADKRKWEK